MVTKSNAIPKRYFNDINFSIDNKKTKRYLVSFLTVILAVASLLLLASKCFAGSSNSKDMFVADFRTDINRLWEASEVIEAMRARNAAILAYGSAGELLGQNDLNVNLKRALLKIADSDGDKKLSGDEIKALGIMKLDGKIYSAELKRLQYNSLSTDNNLDHYIVLTKGKYAGTILYNGVLRFIDSSNRNYYGIELFEQQ